MELIHSESDFTFVKIHLIIHFGDHIYMFGNIPMYSTEYGELAHKEHIKDGWRHANKIDAAQQILSSYGRQHAIRMRLLYLEFLQPAGADLPIKVVAHLEKTRENIYGALRGGLPGRLIALVKIRSGHMQRDTVYHLAGVEFMSLVDFG